MNRPTLLRLHGLLLLLVLSAAAQAADTELRTYALHNRSAQELIPVLRPMLDPRGAISGTGYTLIVRSTPDNLEEIGQLVEELDVAPTSLVISVRQGISRDELEQGGELSGRIQGGGASVGVGSEGGAGDGADVELNDGASHGRVRVYRTERGSDEEVNQRVQVLEGQWARIQVGQQIPLPQRSVTQSPGGISVQESIEYKDVSSGFEVRPRVNDDRVTVDIRPYRNRPAATGGGVIESQQILTTVSGRLGQWLELGGVVEQSHGSRGGIVHSTRDAGHEENRTYIKIEVAP